MIPIDFEEALTIIDYHNPTLRTYNNYPEHQLLGIANDLMKRKGLEWVFLTLSHEENLKKIAKQAQLDKKNNPTNYNFQLWTNKRKEENMKYDERCNQLQIQQSNILKEKNQKKYNNKNDTFKELVKN